MIFSQRFLTAARWVGAIRSLACLTLLLCACVVRPTLAGDATRVALDIRGGVQITRGAQTLCNMIPTAADSRWQFVSAVKVDKTGEDNTRYFKLNVGGGIDGQATLTQKDGQIHVDWTFTARQDVKFNTLAMAFNLPLDHMADGIWASGDRHGTFPREYTQTPTIFNGKQTDLKITDPNGKQWIDLSFPDKVNVLIQDNRKWGSKSYTIRLGQVFGQLAGGESYHIAMTIKALGELTAGIEKEITIIAGKDWVPLKPELDIVPGSALDLSVNHLTQGPCGSKGRVITTPDGHFAFADQPDKPQRFYGANLCFTAQYMGKPQVDQLLDRWLRMGYNTLRIHHYEFRLTKQIWQPGFDWDPTRIDQLCYLIAGCSKRGIWLTTDLFVSRPIDPAQIDVPATKPYIDARKRVDFNIYKALVLVHEPAYQDFIRFADKLLGHVNPYTGKRLAQEPALAWLSLINEGTPNNRVKSLPQWKTAWNHWLAKRYSDRQMLADALGDLKGDEDPARGTVDWPEDVTSDTTRGRVTQVFLADMERRFVQRVRKHLRDDLHCQALLTNHNYGPYTVADTAALQSFDYVDTHFYVDHPIWTNKRWRLPSSSPNINPAHAGVPGGTNNAVVRLAGKPFTVSEFNYAGPGQYRGVGAMMTGALAALQDWDVLWRFAYSHSNKDTFTPAPMDYFNISRDPLAMAADRAAVMLFLRGDLKSADHQVLSVISPKQAATPPAKGLLSNKQHLAWVTRIGNALVAVPPGAIAVPLNSDDAAIDQAVRRAGVPLSDSNQQVRSETDQITIQKDKGLICIDTPLTAGGYAEPGYQIQTADGGLTVDQLTYGATVFVTSLDRKPLHASQRLLVTHLTDLQNTGTRYAESARQTLMAWGALPYLVRDGQAHVQIALDQPDRYTVWALSPGGRRLEKIATTVDGNRLSFKAQVRSAYGARMLYELTTDREGADPKAESFKATPTSSSITGQNLLQFTEPFSFNANAAYKDWKNHANVTDNVLAIKADSSQGGVVFIYFKDLDLSGHADKIPVLHVTIRSDNRAGKVKLMLLDTSKRKAIYVYNLADHPKGKALTLKPSGNASLDKPNSGHVDLNAIRNVQILGDWSQSAVDLTIDGLTLLNAGK